MTSSKLIMKFQNLLPIYLTKMLQGLYFLASNLDASPASDFAGSNQIGGQSPRGDVRRPGAWGWVVAYYPTRFPYQRDFYEGKRVWKTTSLTWTSLSSNESFWKTLETASQLRHSQYLLSAVFRGSSPPYNVRLVGTTPKADTTSLKTRHTPYVSRNEGGCSWASPQHFMVLLAPTSWHFTDFMMVWTEDTTPTLPNSRKLPDRHIYKCQGASKPRWSQYSKYCTNSRGKPLPENRRSGGTSRFPRGYCLKVFV